MPIHPFAQMCVCVYTHIQNKHTPTFLWLDPNITLQWNISVLGEKNGRVVFYYSI